MRHGFKTEEELASHVADWLEELKWAVYQEVQCARDGRRIQLFPTEPDRTVTDAPKRNDSN